MTDAGERERLIERLKIFDHSFLCKGRRQNPNWADVADWILQNYTPKDKGREDA